MHIKTDYLKSKNSWIIEFIQLMIPSMIQWNGIHGKTLQNQKQQRRCPLLLVPKRWRVKGLVNLLNDSSLADVFEYRITMECLPIFNPNGSFRKCQKLKLLRCMEITGNNIDDHYVTILDMGMFIRKAIPNQDQH